MYPQRLMLVWARAETRRAVWLGSVLAGLAFMLLACDRSAVAPAAPATATAVPLITRAPTLTLAPSPTPGAALDETRLSDTAPCDLLTRAQAEELLGEAVTEVTPVNDPATGIDLCMFAAQPGKKFIILTVMAGAAAKQSFANSIVQYQAGCEISYGYNSAATPTALPPEAQALLNQSLTELFKLDRQLQEKCGLTYQALPEFGPDAYGSYAAPILPAGVVSIAGAEHLYSFTYVDDANSDKAGMIEAARRVAAAVLRP